jgi:hypothetical protein
MIRRFILAVAIVASSMWVAFHALGHAILTTLGVPCP